MKGIGRSNFISLGIGCTPPHGFLSLLFAAAEGRVRNSRALKVDGQPCFSLGPQKSAWTPGQRVATSDCCFVLVQHGPCTLPMPWFFCPEEIQGIFLSGNMSKSGG